MASAWPLINLLCMLLFVVRINLNPHNIQLILHLTYEPVKIKALWNEKDQGTIFIFLCLWSHSIKQGTYKNTHMTLTKCVYAYRYILKGAINVDFATAGDKAAICYRRVSSWHFGLMPTLRLLQHHLDASRYLYF